MAQNPHRQWQSLKEEFDVKMGSMMVENERRLKEIVKLSEERFQQALFNKADREIMLESLAKLAPRAEL